MKYRKLGNTNIEISEICMGTWEISSSKSNYWGTQEVHDSVDAIHAALDMGINFFGTAEDYDEGGSEEVLGMALEGQRKNVIIATKVAPRHGWRKDLRNSCEQSLRRLKTDYIDLYQMHFPSQEIPIAESLAEMESLRERGLIRAIGVSNFGTSFLPEVSGFNVVSNQLPYSLLWRAIEFDILPQSTKMGMDILAYSPLMQGLLSGKYMTPDDVPAGRRQTRIFSGSRENASHGEPGCEAEAFTAIRRIQKICQQIGEPMGNVALAWVLAQPGVTSVIAGARNPVQAKQNADAVNLKLDQEIIQELRQVTESLKNTLGHNADMWMHQSRMERQAVGVK